MSVDVEDWFQVGAFENTIRRSDWDDQILRVEDNLARILDLFDRSGIKATFFTLGWIAERIPRSIRAIVERGHELASHGYDHTRVFTFTSTQFRDDLRKSRAILEDCGGTEIRGYRAPSFSIDSRCPWAHQVLAEEGYVYSSSVAPIRHDHYGWRDAPRFAFRPVADAQLVEIPVTTVELGGRRLAAGGGGFFRVLPYAFTSWAIERVNTTDTKPAIFYFHPWEVDPKQPRVANAPLKSRLRHYTKLDVMEAKLERLSSAFEWDRMDKLASQEAARSVEFS